MKKNCGFYTILSLHPDCKRRALISLQLSHYRVKYKYTEREIKGGGAFKNFYRNIRHTMFSLIQQNVFFKTNKLFNKQKCNKVKVCN